MLRKKIIFISMLLLLAIIVACVPLLGQSTVTSSAQPLFDKAVMETVTARAIQQASSGHELSTAFANATALSETTTAQAALGNESYQTTATAIIPVLEELPSYGVNPLEGDVAWLHKPVTISLNGPAQFGYANDYPQITAQDFVLAADITWNTQSSLSGCGFMFHSDGNSTAPNQLMVAITRYAEGSAIFSALVDGNIAYMRYFYPWTKDKSFNWQNDVTNRLVIVVRGKLIDIYTNGVNVAEVDTTKPPPSTTNPPTFPQLPSNPTAEQLKEYQLEWNEFQQASKQMELEMAEAQQNYDPSEIASLTDGFLALMASSSSGTAVCKFSNAWLFLFRQNPTSTPTITPTFAGTVTFQPTISTKVPTKGPFITITAIPSTTFVFWTAVPPPATAVPPTATAVPPTAVPTATTPTPYGAAFLWNDRFNNSEQNREALSEHRLYPVSLMLSITALMIWFGMIIRSSMARSGRKGAIIHSLLTVLLNLIAGS